MLRFLLPHRYCETAVPVFRAMLSTLRADDVMRDAMRADETRDTTGKGESALTAALASHNAGDHVTAARLYREIIAESPTQSVALHHLGIIEHLAGRHDEAIVYVKRATLAAPAWSEAHSNLAAIYRAVKNLDAAMISARTAIALRPDLAPAHANLGGILEDRGDLEAALAAYLQACMRDPNLLDAHLNAIHVLRKLGRHEQALTICNAIAPRHPKAAAPHFNAGNLLRELLQPRAAIAAYRRAIALQPALAEAHCNLGTLLYQQGAFRDAIAAFQDALALDPDLAEAHCNLGAAHECLGEAAASAAAYNQALARDPDMLGVRLQLFHQRRSACDWAGLDAQAQIIAEALPGFERPIVPFHLLNVDVAPELRRKAARLWADAIGAKRRFTHRRPAAGTRKDRLKIGYLSADFASHATTLLAVDLFECHDRSKFEIIAYSHGDDDGSAIRQRLVRAFDRFVDLRGCDDREAAQAIFDEGIDILVELKGYTQFARTAIAAHRPAPLQINFLGYPGTMGADFIDYIVADETVLPMAEAPHYSEKIVHLPDCYQPNDRLRQVAANAPPRQACGLPDEGFIFCCFNQSYKITPAIFAVWMRLLQRVPGSVLWLFDSYPGMRTNLMREAQSRGVDPGRLVFAPRVATPGHLARQKQADLFLDTLPYNAHTTASEALWVGLPVLTLQGESFAGRVAASLDKAIDLPELVTHSLADYEALALRLATNPAELAGIKQKLAANRATAPLFDTPRFARNLERAYRHMWDLWAAGEEAQAFSVAALP